MNTKHKIHKDTNVGIDDIGGERTLRFKDVAGVLFMHRSTIHNWVRDGKLPKPIPLRRYGVMSVRTRNASSSHRKIIIFESFPNRIKDSMKKDYMSAAVALLCEVVTIQEQETSLEQIGKKLAHLARKTIRAGKLRFADIEVIIGVERGTLRQYLESKKGEYYCKLRKETFLASTPAEAGLEFQCFHCKYLGGGYCQGYGDKDYPEDTLGIIGQFVINGIYNHKEQSYWLRKSFGIDISDHHISVVLSNRNKNARNRQPHFKNIT